MSKRKLILQGVARFTLPAVEEMLVEQGDMSNLHDHLQEIMGRKKQRVEVAEAAEEGEEEDEEEE